MFFSEREKTTLHAVLDLALASCGASSGSLFLAQNGELFLVAGRGVEARHFGKREEGAFSRFVFATGVPLFIQDAQVTRPGRRYALLMPIRGSNGKEVLGVLALNREAYPFVDADVAHLSPMVTNIALLLEENILRRRQERLIILLSEIVNLFGDVLSCGDEKAVFSRMFLAIRLLLGISSGAFFRLSPKRPYRVFSSHFPKKLRFQDLGSLDDVSLQEGALRVAPWGERGYVLFIPFSLATKRMGFLFVGFLDEPPDPLDALVTSVVFRLGQMHLEHLVLRREHAKLVRGKERNRLARELHDGLAQILTSIQFYLHFLQNEVGLASSDVYKRLSSLVRMGIEESRCILAELKGKPVSAEQFEAKVREILGVFVSGDLAVHFECTLSLPFLPFRVFHGLSAILQEALSNIRKHAKARNAWVKICEERGMLVCTVRDDGIGFHPKMQKVSGEHFGLLGMKERARLLRGKCSIKSSPQGTTVTVRIPIGGKKVAADTGSSCR